MTKPRWIIKENGDKEKVEKLAEVLNVDKIIANLLVQRGIETYDQARVFFRPEISDLHNPFEMKDMDIAVQRLDQAISKNEKILVFGDYDVDGTTGVALVYRFLRKFTDKLDFYIPDRYNEGYGISFKALDYADENKITLIIAVDCGIKAVEKAEYAKCKNIDLIVCDHHNPGEKIPCALAVLDPKRPECNYPYKELSGCGVAFKLLQAYCIYKNLDYYDLIRLLDLVVVSIGSDIVPITGENRILAYYGLQQLNTEPLPGLKSIIDLSCLTDKEIQINDIVFKIGPRINAAGRMNSGNKAVELLITDNLEYSNDIAGQINLFNDSRKELDHDITEQALEIIKNNPEELNAACTVLYNENWLKGVIGIVASRLIETYHRPTIIFTRSGNFATGSARSVPGFNLYEAIESCSDLLENFGGHMYAAGLTVKIENFPEFKKKFTKYVEEHITNEQKTPVLEADMQIELKDITPKFYRILRQFSPFGPQNMTPTFVTRGVFDNGSGKIVGKSNEHLKLKLVQHLGDNRCIEAIGFGFGEYYDKIKDYKSFDICYQVFENNFMNQTFLQLLIKDIQNIKNSF